MPRKTEHPRLRALKRKTAAGVVTYYFFDMRSEGEKDIPLGTDRAAAIQQWDVLFHGVARKRGRIGEALDRFEKEVLHTYANVHTQRTYRECLAALRPVFEGATWEAVDVPLLKAYLDKRSAKTRANREIALLSLVWGKARLWGLTALPFPAYNMKGWKNPEKPRRTDFADELYTRIHEHADQLLRDCMDLATATGMRITDCRTVLLPAGDVLLLAASKTGKAAAFLLAESPVLSAIVARRRAIPAPHRYLLSTERGRTVSYAMLRHRWDAARAAAVKQAQDEAAKLRGTAHAERLALAKRLGALILRDTRKRAADLAGGLAEASRLLQHSSPTLTAKHYRTRAETIKPTR